jgi:hypothetical protein
MVGAPGISGQVLQTQGPGADSVWAAAGGGLSLLASGSVSGAATLDIVLTSYTSYRALKLLLSSFVPSTDDVELWLRFSTDGGSTYDATGYRYTAINDNDADTDTLDNPDRSTSATHIVIAGKNFSNLSISNVAAEGGADVEVMIHDPSASRWTRARSSAVYAAADTSRTVITISAGTRSAQQDTDAIRVLFESGNIASGKWALYGFS